MKRMYRGEFIFHPIGQGCYYTGELFNEKERLFSFVYDCGTNSEQQYIRDAVAGWPVKAEQQKINVCIISHFHSDHTSGIPQLLKSTRCDRLVIPYYDPFQRLMVYLESDNDDDEYRRMMQNPYVYFSGEGFNIGQIIVVRGGGTETNLQDRSPKAPSPSESSNLNTEQFDLNKDEDEYYQDEYEQNDSLNEQFFRQLQIEDPNADPDKVKVRHLPYQLRTPLYKFIFYTLSEEDGSDIEIKRKTAALRKAVDDYFAAAKRDATSGVSTFQDLFNAKPIKEIARIYRRIFGAAQLNGTSLAVFHRFTLESGGYDIFHRHHSGMRHLYHVNRNHATMMTGDLELNTREKLILFQDYYHAHLDEIAYFQVMHHGSDKNWPFSVTESRLHTFPDYVINHGLGRKHHPGPEVTKLLRSVKPHNTLLNNELTKLHYSIYYGTV
ncbi:MBL fold metallo-hydrolase [Mucilaginibacter mali]|uniref:MBL fold metallo-hydrolase n=1 Tax=Mucilaginibacter mali TaxID=2740462 RepID=A0A7D4QCI6_9SPHI|nr:MBL fold metallo-hydrolase [Mucilaginibacter mali]QKJ28232.1 MBL fold metallo-hydrolase [Mucilaginibacter mali]